ncbi:hypothetical protein BU26DRAFT_236846 [Trematosphaeria pertusa]|uniref:Uncharacterized protein n=1 Tax=Trematosphaeria pertusa TaxID=390896 RepID=A0A6A6HRF7_9PLEO|nr:uncharacterized protein BU26DRAFT_236846 [Trematosphaeria pertusa]KAF2240388.1 hypothetical protein BU26DRAFT_236846 [Trematosphaeria pertusa]
MATSNTTSPPPPEPTMTAASSLPYGLAGFLTHIIIYIILVFLIADRSPWGGRPLKTTTLRKALGFLTIFFAGATVLLQPDSIDDSPPLVLITVNNTTLPFYLGLLCVLAGDRGEQEEKEHEDPDQALRVHVYAQLRWNILMGFLGLYVISALLSLGGSFVLAATYIRETPIREGLCLGFVFVDLAFITCNAISMYRQYRAGLAARGGDAQGEEEEKGEKKEEDLASAVAPLSLSLFQRLWFLLSRFLVLVCVWTVLLTPLFGDVVLTACTGDGGGLDAAAAARQESGVKVEFGQAAYIVSVALPFGAIFIV